MSEDRLEELVSGRYRLKRLLGKGGMGAVYEAVQEPLGRPVALKLLHASLAADASIVARFRREAESAASLAHPNIVQATDFGQTEGGEPFLVMDRITGSPLSDVLAREGALEASRAAFVADQVLAALEAAHAAGVVHRDLKPENVFLTTVSGVHDVVKVLDFGIAALASDGVRSKLTQTGQIIGTPAYMSPEQAMGSSIDARSDLYAVGVMLYEALTGRLPFERETYNALLFAIVGDEATPLLELRPELDPGLATIVQRAMAKRPEARFANANEMRVALEPFVRVWRQGATPTLNPSAATVVSGMREGVAVSRGTPPSSRASLSSELVQSTAPTVEMTADASSARAASVSGARGFLRSIVGAAIVLTLVIVGALALGPRFAEVPATVSGPPQPSDGDGAVASGGGSSANGPASPSSGAAAATPPGGDQPLPVARLNDASKGEWIEVQAPGMSGSLADFDPIANLAWAQGIARRWSMDARLERIDLDGIRADGILDVSSRDDFQAEYRFRSPALEEAGLRAQEVSEIGWLP